MTMKHLAAALAGLALVASPAAAVPDGPPFGGQDPAGFVPPTWAEVGDQAVWLDAPRVVVTPLCPGPPTVPGPLCAPTVAWISGPLTEVRATLRVRVGDLVRFHLSEPSRSRPELTVGRRLPGLPAGKPLRLRLGRTEAPWWRVTAAARSGFAILRTATGSYRLKVRVER
jgi:hypothetical protein